MDLTPITDQIFNALRYIVPVFILATLFKSAWFKGVLGEFIVNVLANFMLDKNEYHLIKNVTLPTENSTTQIDHIIVSRYGVFVVETKNMKGWIFGSAHQRTWTQKIYKHTTKFQNPLRQNYKHTKTLETLLDINAANIHSVIVFVGESTFKTEMPDNVTHGWGYIKFIKSNKNFVLSLSEVQRVIQQIESGRLVRSMNTNREHIKHVKELNTENIKENSCPKCGAQMTVREAKRGPNKGNSFWGCTNFPSCRCIVNIE